MSIKDFSINSLLKERDNLRDEIKSYLNAINFYLGDENFKVIEANIEKIRWCEMRLSNLCRELERRFYHGSK